eukprot:7445513-Alexandrium_andersonii.AAC.1
MTITRIISSRSAACSLSASLVKVQHETARYVGHDPELFESMKQRKWTTRIQHQTCTPAKPDAAASLDEWRKRDD